MRTEDLCELLARNGKWRDDAVAELARLSHRLGVLLTEAKDEHQITVSEAARIAGVSRPMAYKLMAKVGKSGRPD